MAAPGDTCACKQRAVAGHVPGAFTRSVDGSHKTRALSIECEMDPADHVIQALATPLLPVGGSSGSILLE